MSDNAAIAKNRAIYSPAHVFLAALLLAVAIFVQYMPAIDYGFLGWDDTSYIQEDSVVIRGLSKDSLHYAFTTFDNPYFMPLTRLSYMVDVSLYGIEKAAGFRLTNILLHIITSVLLFLLVYSATSRFIAAFLVGLIFGIHPQHVEAVVWIAGRKELLAGLFGLASLCSYQYYHSSKNKTAYLAALLAYGCSLFCKPIWIGLPILLVLWDYFLSQKISREQIANSIIGKAPFLLIGIVFAVLFNLTIQSSETPISYFPEAPWSIRWMLPFIAMGKYLTNTFLPCNLMPYYPFPDEVNIMSGLAWTSLLSGLLIIFWKTRLKYPELLMAALWFGVSLIAALKITLFPQGEAIFVADRYSYLPHIGIFIGLVISLDTWINEQGKYVRYGISIIVLFVLVSITYCAQKTIPQWRTSEQLWKYTSEHTTGKGKAYVLGVLASEYEKQDRYYEATWTYRKAYESYPQQFIYPLMIGSLLSSHFRQVEESNVWFDKLLDESPAPAETLLDYGKNQYLNGNNIRAEMFLTKAVERNQQEGVRLNPKDIYVLLGFAQIKNNHIDKAIATLTMARLASQEKNNICQQWIQLLPALNNQKQAQEFCSGNKH